MELYEALRTVALALVSLFGFLGSLDKAFELYKKYKGLAQAPDKKQDDAIAELRKEINMLKDGYIRVQDALARDLRRFAEIDEVSRLNLQGVQALLKAALTGNNKASMQKSMDEIDEYLLKGATNHGSNDE